MLIVDDANKVMCDLSTLKGSPGLCWFCQMRKIWKMLLLRGMDYVERVGTMISVLNGSQWLFASSASQVGGDGR